MLTSLPETLLAVAVLLIVVSAIQPLARWLMISGTVLLAGVGVVIGGGATLLLNTPHTQAFDDAARAISLYCDLIARSAVDGIARQQGSMGVDIGAMEEVPVEPALEESEAAAASEEAPSAAA